MFQIEMQTSGSNPYHRGEKIWLQSYGFKIFKGNNKTDFYWIYLCIYGFPAYKAIALRISH